MKNFIFLIIILPFIHFEAFSQIQNPPETRLERNLKKFITTSESRRHTNLSIRNNTDATVTYSIVFYSFQLKSWISKGWHTVGPNSGIIYPLDINYNGAVYFYGKSSLSKWEGEWPFCIGNNENDNFIITQADKEECAKTTNYIRFTVSPHFINRWTFN